MNNIHIAILGPVSAGKSTFFNALSTRTCSDMKRKKTTMLPQIYKTVHDESKVDSIEIIYAKNKFSNEQILEKRENKKFNYNEDFNEIVHFINPITDFIVLPDTTATYSILDMPGLNCGGDDLYYDYIRKISSNIDIYLLVFDVNSCLNTSDEIKILELVADEIKKNENGYLHILINKCDEIQFNENSEPFLDDDELQELYIRSKQIIDEKCKDIIDKVSMSPICSSKLYVFRGVKNNISSIDEKQLDAIIKEECGNTELKKCNTPAKKKCFIEGLLKAKGNKSNPLFCSWMKSTGYQLFLESLQKIIIKYDSIIYYHINTQLKSLKIPPTNDNIYFEYLNKLVDIKHQIDLLKQKIPKTTEELAFEVENMLNTYCASHVSHFLYNTDPVDKKILILDKFIKNINIFAEQVGTFIKKSYDMCKLYVTTRENLLISLFAEGFDKKIYCEIYNVLPNEILKQGINKSLQNDLWSFLHIFPVVKKCDIAYECLEEYFNNNELNLGGPRGDITTFFDFHEKHQCTQYKLFVPLAMTYFETNIHIKKIKHISEMCFILICSSYINSFMFTHWEKINLHKIKDKNVLYFYMLLSLQCNRLLFARQQHKYMAVPDNKKYMEIMELFDEIYSGINDIFSCNNISNDSTDKKTILNVTINTESSDCISVDESNDNDSDNDSNNSENDSYNSDNSKDIYLKSKHNASLKMKQMCKINQIGLEKAPAKKTPVKKALSKQTKVL
jgi:hypothetical protein